jgi:predicted metal-dependent peptidase
MSKKKEITRTVEKIEETHETIFRSGVIAASKTMSLCAPAIRGLHLVLTDRVPTIGVDKYFRCYVSPTFIDECREAAAKVSKSSPCKMCGADSHHPIAYIGGAICHESWHLLRSHFERAKNNNVLTEEQGYVWNVAGDTEINASLLQVFKLANVPSKLCLPDFAILPSSNNLPEGKLVEEYYYLLMDELNKLKKKCKTCNGTGKKQDKGQPGKGQDQGQGQQGQGQQGQGQGQGQDQQEKEQEHGHSHEHGHGNSGVEDSCPDCGGTGFEPQSFGKADSGSGADGHERDYEAGEPGPDNPHTGLSEIESRMIRKEVARQIQEAAKQKGNIPGGWKLWADEEIGAPKYNWRSELRKVIARSINTVPGDRIRTFKRLSRRCSSVGHRVILPSFHDSVPTVAIVQDTSGSMGKDNMRVSLEETKGVLKVSQAKVKYINCDMNADKAQNVSSIKDISLYGGGGTDMRVGITAALAERPCPDIIILFTDGYTPWPKDPLPKGKQLVVCLVGKSACEVNEVPQWARVVKIVDEVVDKRDVL